MIIASIVLLAAAGVVIVVARAGVSGRMGINHVAGIRIRSVMVNDETWREGHRAALGPTVIGNVAAGALAVASMVPAARIEVAVALVFGGVGCMLAGVFVGAYRAHRAAVRLAERPDSSV